MREISVQLYHFSELSDEAKEKAIQQYREDTDYFFWMDENMDSLAKFAEWIDGKTDYSVGLCKGSYAFISLNWHEEDYDDFEEGENATLYWITDNLPEKECSFTGYYMDEVLLQPFREYLDNPTEDGLQQLASEAVRLWKKAVEDDMRYQLSDEYIIDTIEANDYEFTVNGELY